jgi:hypothetical protein
MASTHKKQINHELLNFFEAVVGAAAARIPHERRQPAGVR